MHNNLSSNGELQNIVKRVHDPSCKAGPYPTSKTKIMKSIKVPVQNLHENMTVLGQDIENMKSFAVIEARINEKSKDS